MTDCSQGTSQRTRFVVVLLLSLVALSSAADMPVVKRGVLDLQQWNFESDGGLRLNGEWQFAWKRLLEPGEVDQQPIETFIDVPGAWNGKTVADTPLDSSGYATYQLTILLPEGHPALALAVPEINMAAKLWANNDLIFTAGQVGSSRETEVAKSVPEVVLLPEEDVIKLTLQVSNFYHMEGGVPRVITLDRRDRIMANAESRLLLNVLTIGALLFLGLHYLGIYVNQRSNSEHLLYALLAFLMLIRLVVVNKLTYLIGEHPHILSTRLSYTTVFLVPPLYVMFLHKLFPQEFSGRFARAFVIAGVICAGVVWTTQPILFTQARDTTVVMIQLLMLYVLIMTLVAWLRGRDDALTFLTVVVIFGASILYDTLLYQRVIYSNDISSYGFLAFILGHAAILGRRSARAAETESKARQELAELTQTLQARVEERTADLEKAKEAAERALRAKSRFLSAASHDLRQPLHALNLFTGMLEPSIRQGTWKKAVAKIRQSLQGLDKFLLDLSEMGRIESGRIVPDLMTISLQVYFEILFDEFELECREKGLELTFVRTSLYVRTDPNMFGRILRNLVSNAIKYTPTGRILVGCRRKGAVVRVEVWDTGIGISDTEREAIFDELYRADEARSKASGFGLGLSIVRHTVDLLGYELELRSKKGIGSCFSVSLPVATGDHYSDSQQDEVGIEAGEISDLTILFVDDDQVICTAMEDVFNQWNCTIYTVNCLEEAVTLVEQLEPELDLLISDFRFPDGFNGLDVAAAVCKIMHRPPPVLIITAESDEEQLARIRERHYPVLLKPVSTEALYGKVRKILGFRTRLRSAQL